MADSDSVSDIGTYDEFGDEFGLEAHRFEPLADQRLATVAVGSSEGTGSDTTITSDWKLSDLAWCRCQKCHLMKTVVESKCCLDIKETTGNAGNLVAFGCITDHPGFKPACLDKWSLYTAYRAYRNSYGHMPKNDNERYRFTAYRQMVYLCWGWLGKDNRVQLPACAVSRIREEFPSESGSYKGFLPSLADPRKKKTISLTS